MTAPDAPMRAVLARIAELAGDGPSRYALPFPESRRALAAQRVWWQAGAPDCAVQRFTIAGTIECVRMTPPARRTPAVIVYLHGGGWCVGASEATHGAILKWIAVESACDVIGVDYSLAPEHPFPRAIGDVRIALDAIFAAHADPVVLMGDSAGANLALVDALARRQAGAPLPRGLILYYGTYGPVRRDGSFARFGNGEYGLSLAALDRYLAAYAPGQTDSSDRRLFPLYAELAGLPPLLIVAAGCDPLLDDSAALAARARAAGVPVDYREIPAVPHGFLAYWRMLDAARAEFRATGAQVRKWCCSAKA